MKEEEFYGKRVIINGPVKFIGNPEDDPKNNPWFQLWENAFKKAYSQQRWRSLELSEACPDKRGQSDS